jgi:zinc and cadmium transporter
MPHIANNKSPKRPGPYNRKMLLALLAGLFLALLSLSGALALRMPPERFQRVIPLLVALAAGALIGGALFHLLPETVHELGEGPLAYGLLAGAFVLFFALEQFLHWHHCHRAPLKHEPVGYMLLGAGAIHSLLDGLALGAAFAISPELGLLATALIAAHEIPQAVGDLGALVHSGWTPRRALLWNFISALPFLPGAGLAFALSAEINPAFLLPLAAGGFLYIGASDLLPQLRPGERARFSEFGAFLFGLGLLFLLALVPH